MFEKKIIPQPKHKCKIKIKRGKDGSITKSIDGTCSKEELAALNMGDA